MNETLYEQMRTASSNDWLAGLRRDTVTHDWCSALPVLPDEQFQRRFVGKAHADALQQAHDAVDLFKRGIEQLGGRFSPTDHVVDSIRSIPDEAQEALNFTAVRNVKVKALSLHGITVMTCPCQSPRRQILMWRQDVGRVKP